MDKIAGVIITSLHGATYKGYEDKAKNLIPHRYHNSRPANEIITNSPYKAELRQSK
jgi:hypothetical protein